MRLSTIVCLIGALELIGAGLFPLRAQDTTRVVVDTATKYKSDSLPLKPTRTISFDTDEGTWISLDVSPDGRPAVFELLGDLYTLPVGGGQAKRITSVCRSTRSPVTHPTANKSSS